MPIYFHLDQLFDNEIKSNIYCKIILTFNKIKAETILVILVFSYITMQEIDILTFSTRNLSMPNSNSKMILEQTSRNEKLAM